MGDTLAIFPVFTQEAKEEAWRTLGVPNILPSLVRTDQMNLDSMALDYNKVGAYLLKK